MVLQIWMCSSRNTVASSAASSSSPTSSDTTGPTVSSGVGKQAYLGGVDAGTDPVIRPRAHFNEEERVALHGHADHMMYSPGHAYYYGRKATKS